MQIEREKLAIEKERLQIEREERQRDREAQAYIEKEKLKRFTILNTFVLYLFSMKMKLTSIFFFLKKSSKRSRLPFEQIYHFITECFKR